VDHAKSFVTASLLAKQRRMPTLRAYRAKPSANARKSAARLLNSAEVIAEIGRQRKVAEEKAGSSVLTLIEKRQWCARLLRADLSNGDVPGDLWAGCDFEKRPNGVIIHKIRLPDRIAAMKLDNDLEGVGAEAEANKAITINIRRTWGRDGN
jgi:hypothetical protein